MRLWKYLYGCLAVWLAFTFSSFMILMSGYELLLGTRGTAFFIQGVLNSMAAVCGILLGFLHYRRTGKALENKAVLFLTAVGIILLMVCWNGLCMFCDGSQEYHSFTSPDGAHTIVLMENVSLISGQVVLYERVNPVLISPRERIITDDGYRPVCAGEYALVWDGDTVEFTAADGAGGKKTIVVSLQEG